LYDGPYLVLERSLHFFKIQLGTRTDTVSTHRLKACHAPFDAEAALPPARGRPRAARADPERSGGSKKISEDVPAIQVPGRSGGSKKIPNGLPTVHVPWAGAAAGHLIPPEARGIGSRSTNGLPAVRASERGKKLHEGLQLSHDVPAVRAPRISPACAANNPIEGRAHATLPAPIAGSSAASGRESTPALRGVLPPLGGDPIPGSPLRGRASCLRNGPGSPASVRGWAANKPTRPGTVGRRVGLSLIPKIIPDAPAPTDADADAGGGRPRRKTRPPARYSH